MSDRHLIRRSGAGRSLVGWLIGLTFTTAALPTHAMKITHWTPAAIVSDQYESSPTFTPDGREMYFMRSNRSFTAYQILRSRCGPDGWGPPESVPFGLPPPVNDADPFVTADGKRLYFVSSRPFAGKLGDDLDIWMVERTATGTWSDPVRLPEPVNSAHAELMPRAMADGRIVFGSDRPGGVGGTDIYVATPQPNGQWRVANLGPDVNRIGNDYEAEVSQDGRTMVVVSDRGDRSHLYRFVKDGERWREVDRVPARADVFQVGPLLSPMADRLLFAQVDGDRSGKMFLADLVPNPDPTWPPQGCTNRSSK
jgi:Tol biopolymer transport system component